MRSLLLSFLKALLKKFYIYIFWLCIDTKYTYKFWLHIYEIKFAIVTILSVSFPGINYIHNLMQPSTLRMYKTFSSLQTKPLNPLRTCLPIPFPLASSGLSHLACFQDSSVS